MVEEIETGYITTREIKAEIKCMKTDKATEIDSIVLELLWVHTVDTLCKLFKKIWDSETAPQDCAKGLLV